MDGQSDTDSDIEEVSDMASDNLLLHVDTTGPFQHPFQPWMTPN